MCYLYCGSVIFVTQETLQNIMYHKKKILNGFRNISITFSKGFEQKVATLRLKTQIKMKDNFIGNNRREKKPTRISKRDPMTAPLSLQAKQAESVGVTVKKMYKNLIPLKA